MYYKVKGNFYPEILTFKLKVTKNLQDMLVQTFTDIIIKDFYTVHNMANCKLLLPCSYKTKTIPTDETWCTCEDLLQLH